MIRNDQSHTNTQVRTFVTWNCRMQYNHQSAVSFWGKGCSLPPLKCQTPAIRHQRPMHMTMVDGRLAWLPYSKLDSCNNL